MAASRCDLAAQSIITFDIGLGFTPQGQRLRGIQRWTTDNLAIDQPVQEVQHVGLGRHALGQCQFHGGKHSLLIVLQDECEDINRLVVAAGLAEHMILQLLERKR